MSLQMGQRPLFLALIVVGTGLFSAGTDANISEPQRVLEQLSGAQQAELLRTLGETGQSSESRLPAFPQLVNPVEPEFLDPAGPPRLEPGQTVIVEFQLPENTEPNAAAAQDAEDYLRRNPQLEVVRGANTYVIDAKGLILFPGVVHVKLAGLTEEEAALRLEATPQLRPFKARVNILPLQKLGAEALEPFGYELFQGAPVTFAPATDIPVPAEYVMGPGDQVRVQLFGKENVLYELPVNREGAIEFPRLGPIVVAGLSFAEMRALLQERLAEQMVGVSASITLGELRSIRVFVLGDVRRPGSFTVSGLSTITNALFVSGGVMDNGSLRRIQLKREGRTVATLDLYDLLLRGDTSDDVRLQPQDVLFVPPRGTTVAIHGEVQRPAIYELAQETRLQQVIDLAGGTTHSAFPGSVRVERLDGAGGRRVETVDIGSKTGREFLLAAGDVIEVGSALEVITNQVALAGHVHRPGSYEWRPGMTLTDLLGSVDALKPGADRQYVLVRRQADLSGPVQVFSVDLETALAAPRTAADPPLQPLDEVNVFDLGSGRVSVVDPLIETLRQQAVFGLPAREVSIGGMVRAPGTYPLEEGMRISDLIRAGANLKDSAFGMSAELTRYEVRDGTRRVIELVEVDLAGVLSGDWTSDLVLSPYDFLSIRQVSGWRRQGVIELRGEVHFPGIYTFEPGEKLSSVIARAGGLTEHAFPQGSVLLRDDLRRREREEIDRLITRLEGELATLALQASRAAAVVQGARSDHSLAIGQSLLAQLRSAQPMGRLVIDLPAALQGDEDNDVTLRDGDTLYIPERSQEVMVLGEVQYPTSHVFRRDTNTQHYLSASGGLTANSDERRMYIVRANGAVVTDDERSRRRRVKAMDVAPGDTIVVPINIDRVPALALWQSSTTILYNLAITVAAIASL